MPGFPVSEAASEFLSRKKGEEVSTMLAVDSLCVDSINGMAVTVELLIILF